MSIWDLFEQSGPELRFVLLVQERVSDERQQRVRDPGERHKLPLPGLFLDDGHVPDLRCLLPSFESDLHEQLLPTVHDIVSKC